MAGSISEKQIEAYLRDEVKKIGGKAYKFVSPGNNGVPDRLVCLPGGVAIFVELKAPGKKSTAAQIAKQREIRKKGFRVFEDIDSKESVDTLIETRFGTK